MGDEIPYGGLPVRAHHRHVHAGDPPVDEHHRRPRPGGVQHQGRATVGGGDEQPVDAPVEQVPYVVVLELGPLVGVPDDHAVAERAGLFLDGTGQLGEVRIQHVADDQPEGMGLVRPKGPGDGVRPVPQGLDGPHHPRPRVGTDGRMPVQHARHGGHGHARRSGHVLDARHRRPHLLVDSWNRLHRCRREDWNRLHGLGARGRGWPRPNRDRGAEGGPPAGTAGADRPAGAYHRNGRVFRIQTTRLTRWRLKSE